MRDTYRDGYTKALLDVKNWVDNHSDSLKYFRCFSSKRFPLILQALLDQREILMKYGEDAEIDVPTEALSKKVLDKRLQAFKEERAKETEKFKEQINFARDMVSK